MTTLSPAPLVVEGVWVKRPGGVRVLVDAPALKAPPGRDPREPKPVVDVHTLRACLSCPARMDEFCVSNATGKRRGQGAHPARLVSRVCSCGGRLSAPNAQRCADCAHERHREQQRLHVSIKRAVLRERRTVAA